MFAAFRKLFRGSLEGATKRPRLPGFRLETLEDRCTPASFEVDTTAFTSAVNPNNSADDANGKISLRSAIQRANALAGQDSITFSTSLGPSISIALPAGMDSVTDDLIINGPGASALWITRDPMATGNFSLFTVSNSADCYISDLSFMGGHASSGGAIYNYAVLHLANCNLYSNTATSAGGAIYNAANADLYVSNCGLWYNHADFDGGAIYNGNYGEVDIYGGSQIFSNTAGRDGGGICSSGWVDCYGDTDVYSNSAESDGGGIWCSGPLTYHGGTIYANSATGMNSKGGGLYMENNATLDDGISITFNSANKGGGIYARAGTTALDYFTLTDNMAMTLGAGYCFKAGDANVTTSNVIGSSQGGSSE